MRHVAACVVCALGVLAGCFPDHTLPKNAQLVCLNDDDCPAQTVCVQALHECRAPGSDIDTPQVIEATFDPPAARDNTVARLVVRANEALDGSGSLTFGQGVPDPGFVLASTSDPNALTFQLDVSPDNIEGLYPLESILIVDAVGNAVSWRFNDELVFEIDRTAPRIENVRVDDGSPEDPRVLLSDVAGSNLATVNLTLSEQVATEDVRVQVGSIPLECSAPVALNYACSGNVSGIAINGAQAISIEATDSAGNVGRNDQNTVSVDIEPPNVVGGSVTVTLTPSDTTATIGTRIEVGFLVDEAVGSVPSVVLNAGVETPLESLGAQGNYHRYAHTLDGSEFTGESANAQVVTTLVDIFGHVRPALAIQLPAPFSNGIPLQRRPQSPCVVIDHGQGNSCTDADGDGAIGASPNCTSFTDCDDNNAAISPQARELPGNAIDEDCDGMLAPTVLDESVAVFAAPNGSNTAAGTRLDPHGDLSAALADAQATGRVLALARGDFATGPQMTFDVNILGGRHEGTWEPTNTLSIVSSQSSVTLHNITAAGVETNAVLTYLELALVVDSTLEDTTVRQPSTLVNTTVDTILIVNPGASGTMIVGGSLPYTLLDGDTTFDGVVVQDDILVGAGVALRAVDSAFVGRQNAGVACLGCALIGLFHSNVYASSGATYTIEMGTSGVSELVIVSSVIRAAGSAAIHTQPTTQATLLGNLFSLSSGGVPLVVDTTEVSNVDLVDGCTWSGCSFATSNTDGQILFQADRLSRVQGELEGSAQGVDAFTFGGPSSAAMDPNGDCRTDPPSIGPDQVP